MRLSEWRQKPIYGHFLSVGWIQASMKIVSLSLFPVRRKKKQTNYETDGVRDRKRGRGDGKEETYGVADIDREVRQATPCYR